MNRTSPFPNQEGRFRFVARWVLAIALLAGVSAQAQDRTALRELERTNAKILRQAGPAVVAIARVRRNTPQPTAKASPLIELQPVGPDDPAFVPDDFGAGVLIKANNPTHPKLILTNYHVVRGGPVLGSETAETKFDLWVSATGGVRFKTSIIAADPHSDLAVLSVNGSGTRDTLTALSPSTQVPKKGQFVFALGNPFAIARDGSASAAWGIVSNVDRSPFQQSPDFDNDFTLFETVHHLGTLMQISVPLPVGTSGGAVLNMDGELIGMTTSLAPLEGYETSAGFAVPFTSGFRRVIEELTKGYEVEYGFLGVRPINASDSDFDGMPSDQRPNGGVVVISVTPNSPGTAAGLKANDVIVSINQQSIGTTLDLMREVAMLGPNVKAAMKLWRPGEKRFTTRSVTLGKWPVRNDADVIATAYRQPTWRGIRVDYATARSKYLRGGGTIEFADAVVVISVDEKSGDLRLQPGDFISHVGEERVRTPAEFTNATRKTGDQAVTLRTTDDRTIEIK